MTSSRLAYWLALGAGALDFSTGLGLVADPAWILHRMGVPVPAGEALVWVRFVGCFVGAVGGSYLWASLQPTVRLHTVLGATILFRIAAGTFTGAAVWQGELAPGWLAVAVTDWALVVAQLWLLAKEAGRDA